MELQQIADFRDEAAELHSLLATIAPPDWGRPTQFKQWTPNDIIQHLHDGDVMALASATDPANFAARAAEVVARRSTGLTRIQEARQRFGDLKGARLLQQWHDTLTRLCAALAAKDPQARLVWYGPDMGLRMFATARQMETWAHGQAIYDMLGTERPHASPRLRNIAEIGVRTFGWAYRNRGRDIPAEQPFIHLRTPSGEIWEWNDPAAPNRVEGDALGFCQVVTQTRNVADTALRVTGPVAQDWMAIVQCFAGPPETPPAPGTRFRVWS